MVRYRSSTNLSTGKTTVTLGSGSSAVNLDRSTIGTGGVKEEQNKQQQVSDIDYSQYQSKSPTLNKIDYSQYKSEYNPSANVGYTPYPSPKGNTNVGNYNPQISASPQSLDVQKSIASKEAQKYEAKYGSFALTRTPEKYGIKYISTTSVPEKVQEYTKGQKIKTRDLTATNILFGNPEKVASRFEGKSIGAFGVEAPPEFSKNFAGAAYSGLAPGNLIITAGAGALFGGVSSSQRVANFAKNYPKVSAGLKLGGTSIVSGLATYDIGSSIIKGEYAQASGKVVRDVIGLGVFSQGQSFQRTLGRTPTIPKENIRDVTSISKLNLKSKYGEIRTYDVKIGTEIQTEKGYGLFGRTKSFYVTTKGGVTTTPFKRLINPEYTVTIEKPKGVLFKGFFKTNLPEGFTLIESQGLGFKVEKPMGNLQYSFGAIKEGSIPTKFKIGTSKSFKVFKATSEPSYDIYFGRFKLFEDSVNAKIRGTQYTLVNPKLPISETELEGATFYRKNKKLNFKLPKFIKNYLAERKFKKEIGIKIENYQSKGITKPFEWMKSNTAREGPVSQISLSTEKVESSKVKQIDIVKSQAELITKRIIQNIPVPQTNIPLSVSIPKSESKLKSKPEIKQVKIYTPVQSEGILQSSLSKSIQINKPKDRYKLKTRDNLGQSELSQQKNKQIFRQVQLNLQGQATKQKQIALLRVPTKTQTKPEQQIGIDYIPPLIEIPPLPNLNIEVGSRLGNSPVRALNLKAYIPDYTSLITRKRGSAFKGISTGFETRPIPKGFSFTKLRIRKIKL